MFFYGLSGAVTLLVEFKGVDDVLPDAVEAAGDGGYRGHVGVAQPDKEAGVLLSEGLSGGDLVRSCHLVVLASVGLSSGQSPDRELEDCADQ